MDEKEFGGENMEMDDDLIVFEDEDGNEITFVIEDYFFYNGEEYAVLTEYDTETDNVKDEGSIVCKIESVVGEDGEEDEEFVPVEDEEMAEKLINIANEQLSADEEEE
ncbi:MAG: DUF1292 domain-containing protein [Clostridia bacterium]|nr:DUF1292 domain-containing protein [Clostridia bacterium]